METDKLINEAVEAFRMAATNAVRKLMIEGLPEVSATLKVRIESQTTMDGARLLTVPVITYKATYSWPAKSEYSRTYGGAGWEIKLDEVTGKLTVIGAEQTRMDV